MATKRASSFIERYRSHAGRAHPHLDPINGASFERDRDIVLSTAEKLAAYQRYLTAARRVKARRKGVSLAFERHVRTQGRQALEDLQEFSGAALRMVQQVNHTSFWSQTFGGIKSTLGPRGRVSLREMWKELQQHDQYRAVLLSHGVTNEMITTLSESISTADTHLMMRDDRLI